MPGVWTRRDLPGVRPWRDLRGEGVPKWQERHELAMGEGAYVHKGQERLGHGNASSHVTVEGVRKWQERREFRPAVNQEAGQAGLGVLEVTRGEGREREDGGLLCLPPSQVPTYLCESFCCTLRGRRYGSPTLLWARKPNKQSWVECFGSLLSVLGLLGVASAGCLGSEVSWIRRVSRCLCCAWTCWQWRVCWCHEWSGLSYSECRAPPTPVNHPESSVEIHKCDEAMLQYRLRFPSPFCLCCLLLWYAFPEYQILTYSSTATKGRWSSVAITAAVLF
jgi:hypothetical protein